ncbi:UNVERIFIED_CONTAM: hypothetical protein K2H54_046624 [Gekko kuhli]
MSHSLCIAVITSAFKAYFRLCLLATLKTTKYDKYSIYKVHFVCEQNKMASKTTQSQYKLLRKQENRLRFPSYKIIAHFVYTVETEKAKSLYILIHICTKHIHICMYLELDRS